MAQVNKWFVLRDGNCAGSNRGKVRTGLTRLLSVLFWCLWRQLSIDPAFSLGKRGKLVVGLIAKAPFKGGEPKGWIRIIAIITASSISRLSLSKNDNDTHCWYPLCCVEYTRLGPFFVPRWKYYLAAWLNIENISYTFTNSFSFPSNRFLSLPFSWVSYKQKFWARKRN